MKKDFDKLSIEELKNTHSLYHQQQLDNKELSDLIKNQLWTPINSVPTKLSKTVGVHVCDKRKSIMKQAT